MQCIKCGVTLPAGSVYCNICGVKQQKGKKKYNYVRKTFIGADGKRHEVRAANSKEALKKQYALEAAIEHNEVPTRKLTVGQWVKEYLDTYQKPASTPAE